MLFDACISRAFTEVAWSIMRGIWRRKGKVSVKERITSKSSSRNWDVTYDIARSALPINTNVSQLFCIIILYDYFVLLFCIIIFCFIFSFHLIIAVDTCKHEPFLHVSDTAPECISKTRAPILIVFEICECPTANMPHCLLYRLQADTRKRFLSFVAEMFETYLKNWWVKMLYLFVAHASLCMTSCVLVSVWIIWTLFPHFSGESVVKYSQFGFLQELMHLVSSDNANNETAVPTLTETMSCWARLLRLSGKLLQFSSNYIPKC